MRNIKIKKLIRFTTLPFLLDLIERKKITLLNPELWEDYNDRKTIKVYQELIQAKSIYALCLTYKSETVHHWSAFSSGPSGCSIEFNYKKLLPFLKEEHIRHSVTEYVKIINLDNYTKENYQTLPFVKRSPFANENEYRIVTTSDAPQQSAFDIHISLDIINKIALSNKLPKIAYESVKKAILKLEPAMKGKIRRSELFENAKWIKHFSNIQNSR